MLILERDAVGSVENVLDVKVSFLFPIGRIIVGQE